MDKLEEFTTTRVFKEQFPSIAVTPRVVYPGINLDAYGTGTVKLDDPDIASVLSDRPTLLSLNRFEQKKNAGLAIDSFALLRAKLASSPGDHPRKLRLVLAGGYDPRLLDNVKTLQSLLESAKRHGLTYKVTTPSTSTVASPALPFRKNSEKAPQETDILFLLNFSIGQRSALLTSSSTLALLYTPANEHFGIGPVEGMACGLPVLACDSGGPTESVVGAPVTERTGWLRRPEPKLWAEALLEIFNLSEEERSQLAERARRRAREKFGMEAMARDLEDALQKTAGMGPPS
ncbi:hypothetical protein BN946_scf184940.g36 [Trametes cinnabarina]|uniref:Alpha-1,3/1,6-mannosyltransferase ALG2 n=1 Tax=Pycnoporus cinnabarinus TaxID=5643 RepID=A0A060SI48_PYCCI|nr:hypothetical protein BN946_scf184940.g36 [Trametes cinnabarina]